MPGIWRPRLLLMIWLALVAMVLLWGPAPAIAQEATAVSRALNWLQTQVQADGSLAGEAASIAAPLQARSEAHATLKALASSPLSLQTRIGAAPEELTEFVARQLITGAAAPAATGLQAELASRQNPDGGFGGAAGYASNALDTAWVLLAHQAVRSSNAALISSATAYLLAVQDAGGGYGMIAGEVQVHVSAVVATALQSVAATPSVMNATNRLDSFLRARQGAGGDWGSVAETASAYLALAGSVSDAALQSSVRAYLLASQSADGAWQADPYTTALATRALVAQPRPVLTTGKVVLRAIEGATGLPLANASAVLQGAALAPSLSDASGLVAFTDVPAGAYTALVSAPGFAPRSASFTLLAGTTAELGNVVLAVAPTTGLLKGVVRIAATGAPLADAMVSISGANVVHTVTAGDGSYTLPGLAPGAVSIIISKAGFASVNASASISAGTALVFSPALALPGAPAETVGTLLGQAIDAATLAPLPGVLATVSGAGKSALSGVDGKFSITGIAAGTYPVSFSKSGYSGKSFAGVLVAAGSTGDFQVLAFAREMTTVAVSGTLRDLASGAPIAQATVVVAGTELSGRTDAAGAYRIEGLAPGASSIRFTASGYTGETVALTMPAPGEFRLDKTLALDGGANPNLVSFATDLPAYGAHQPVSFTLEAANTSASVIAGANLDVAVFGPHGQALSLQQAVRLDADGVAHTDFELAANSTTTANVKWSTMSYAPGLYRAKARLFTESGTTNGRTILAERTLAFMIEPSRNVLRLSIVPEPAFSVFEAVEQVRFKVEATHQSNLPVTVGFRYVFSAPDGAVIKEEQGSITLPAASMTESILTAPFAHTFRASGIYPVVLSADGDAVPLTVANGQVQIAPGIRVEARQQVNPTMVTPDGDKRIRIQLQLKGVEQK